MFWTAESGRGGRVLLLLFFFGFFFNLYILCINIYNY